MAARVDPDEARRWLQSHSTAWAAYAACVLALLYAVPSFYWALSGTAGRMT
jgi:hypothetical protein